MTGPTLPVRVTTEMEFLGAIVDTLVEQNTLLRQLLDQQSTTTTPYDQGGSLKPGIVAVRNESSDEILVEVENWDKNADLAAEMTTALENLAVTAPETENVRLQEPTTTPPPRIGRGSSAAAWLAYAASHGVTVPEDATRTDIITACQQAGIPT